MGRSGKLQVGCARRKSPLPYGARQVPPWRVLRPRSLTPRRQPLEKSATDWRTQVKEIEEANEAGTFALSALLVARALPRANTEQSRRRSKHHPKPPLIRDPLPAQPTQPPSVYLYASQIYPEKQHHVFPVSSCVLQVRKRWPLCR